MHDRDPAAKRLDTPRGNRSRPAKTSLAQAGCWLRGRIRLGRSPGGAAVSHSMTSLLAAVPELARSRVERGARLVAYAAIRGLRLLFLAALAVGGVVLWLVAAVVAGVWVLGARGLARLRRGSRRGLSAAGRLRRKGRREGSFL